MPRLVQLVLLFLAFGLLSGRCYSDIDVTFAETERRTVGGTELVFDFLGQAKREFFFFDIYDIGNYVAQGWRSPASSIDQRSHDLLTSTGNRMLILKYHRNLKLKKIREVLIDGFKKNTREDQWSNLQQELKAFLERIDKDIEKGDELELIWVGKNSLEVSFNGSVYSEHKSELFLRTLWSIWLGEHSVVKRSRLFER